MTEEKHNEAIDLLRKLHAWRLKLQEADAAVRALEDRLKSKEFNNAHPN